MSTSRTLLFVACVALVCTARAYADDADDAEHEDYDFYHQVEYKGHDTVDEQHVHILTYENFTEFIESHKHVMVEFYAPWCHHCKTLKPEYAGAATEIAKVTDASTTSSSPRCWRPTRTAARPRRRWRRHPSPSN